MKPTIGLFGWIFNPEGKLLVKQREQGESLPGEWDLPGGGAEESAAEKATDERLVHQELTREVQEETGLILIALQQMPPMYPAIGPGGKDWAFGVNIGIVTELPTKGNYRYVSPEELEELANNPVGNRLVSGYGKRMHRLCLCGLAMCSPKEIYRNQATEKIQKIWESWN